MARAYKLIVALVFLFTVVLVSGCYTMVGRPSVVDGTVVGAETEEIVEDRVYEYYGSEYGRTYPYYQDYYGLWYPQSYYYWNGPRWYYDRYPTRYYYDHDYDYDGQYVPEKKPETRRRGATDTWRSLRSRERSETAPEQDREREQPNREIRNRWRTEDRPRRAPTQRKSTTTQRSSTKRKSKDEEE